MNRMPLNTLLVTDIVENRIKIKVFNKTLVKKMKELGFYFLEDHMQIDVSTELIKIEKIKELIKHEALFLYGYGWYPSEVMKYYKENGVVFENFKVISWTNPDSYTIEKY